MTGSVEITFLHLMTLALNNVAITCTCIRSCFSLCTFVVPEVNFTLDGLDIARNADL